MLQLVNVLIVLLYGYCSSSNALITDSCTDLEKVYTECKAGSAERWEVTVSRETDCSLPAPVKVASCDKTCSKGEILTNFTKCDKCQPGTYSQGDEKIYPVLNPDMFPDVSFVSTKIAMSKKKCDQISVQDNTVVLPADQCYHDVTIPLLLLQPGHILLEYYYPDTRVDLIFNLKTSNSVGCGSGTTIKSSAGVSTFNWQTLLLPVKTKGRYLLEIKATAFFSNETVTDTTVPLEPARIGKLSVAGIEPYTKCTNCRHGFVAKTEGASECTACSANYHSNNGQDCNECTSTQYSLAGAGTCSERVQCGSQDYIPVVGECVEGKSTVTTTELTPNKCSNPAPSERYSCLECQPGTEKRDNTCQFCAEGTHNSDGGMCEPCDPNTISLKGIYQVWWSVVPAAWKLRCSSDNTDNTDNHGNTDNEAARAERATESSKTSCWLPAGPFLLGRTNSFQPIAIDFGEIEYSSKPITSNVVGLFTLQFTLACPGTCSLLVIKEVTTATTAGKVRRREVMRRYEESVGGGEGEVAHFNVIQSQDNKQHFSLQLSGAASSIKLHTVNFTNTAVGGSSFCFPCKGDNCMECAPGMIYKDGGCTECPANTYHVITGNVLNSDYVSSCEPCPEGTVSAKGTTSCYTHCNMMTSSGQSYDISKLEDVLVYDQPDSYPDQQGNRFHYRYKMALCSSSSTAPTVACIEDSQDTATGQICQINVITSTEGDEVLTHPVDKADMLLGITEQDNGLTLHYTILHSSTECEEVATNVTLICNRDQTGEMRLVKNTVCSLLFEYSGPFGCRKCVEADYRAITSSCVAGTQNITHVRLEGVVCTGGVPLPPGRAETCTPYQDSLIDSIKRFKLYVGLGIGTVLLLITGLCFLCWYSSTLKHKLDGYSQMSYAQDDNYMGTKAQGFAWEESASDDDTNTTLYTKYKGPTPGAILANKLSQFNHKFGIKKYKRFDDQDIMRMTGDPGI